ncbi:hypothetical protein [Bradyrhizobium elkanii]|uniref:hypothetical protein n=1 Tax=Bradyrhizobium elkanii TaxID=29448 RepID=UPI00272B3224|nr:hypothetical protein [Bradyrhizobium elkanii]WLA79588.1 hypothetical protein QNJ99_29855 [Bradyrhizobium elkanii]
MAARVQHQIEHGPVQELLTGERIVRRLQKIVDLLDPGRRRPLGGDDIRIGLAEPRHRLHRCRDEVGDAVELRRLALRHVRRHDGGRRKKAHRLAAHHIDRRDRFFTLAANRLCLAEDVEQ